MKDRIKEIAERNAGNNFWQRNPGDHQNDIDLLVDIAETLQTKVEKLESFKKLHTKKYNNIMRKL